MTDKMLTLLEELRKLHRQGQLHILDHGEVCLGCGGQWPCATYRIMTKWALDTLEGHV